LVAWRPAVEQLVLDTTVRGIRGIVIRPARVYGGSRGPIAKIRSGAEPLVGSGDNHWSFVHVEDLAELYVLAFENAPAGSVYVAADGPPVSVKDLAAACGITAMLPLEEARRKMGPLADALVMDQRIGSTRAGRELGWKPSRPGVLQAIRQGQA
jgi:nucleoside-diphosphate-sugar epimerase